LLNIIDKTNDKDFREKENEYIQKFLKIGEYYILEEGINQINISGYHKKKFLKIYNSSILYLKNNNIIFNKKYNDVKIVEYEKDIVINKNDNKNGINDNIYEKLKKILIKLTIIIKSEIFLDTFLRYSRSNDVERVLKKYDGYSDHVFVLRLSTEYPFNDKNLLNNHILAYEISMLKNYLFDQATWEFSKKIERKNSIMNLYYSNNNLLPQCFFL
jgi:hypothetical protein